MPPSKTRAAATLPTIHDEAKYRSKYKELKVKINEIEEDNTKLQLRILKSKKAIQRLRIERAIIYDRLQSYTAPTNPYALHTTPHLSSLPPSAPATATAPAPPTILDPPTYPLADPAAPSKFLQQLDGEKLRLLQGAARYGDRPVSGVDAAAVGGGVKAETEDGPVDAVNGAAGQSNGAGAEVPTSAVEIGEGGMEVDV